MLDKILDNEKFNDIEKLLLWNVDSFKTNYNSELPTFPIFYNYIYHAHLGHNIGSEQSDNRPVLVVDSYKSSSTCVVIPITLERLTDNKDYHVDLSNGKGTALIEQIRTISKLRIFDKVYHNKKHATITEEDRISINEQLSKICTLKEIFQK